RDDGRAGHPLRAQGARPVRAPRRGDATRRGRQPGRPRPARRDARLPAPRLAGGRPPDHLDRPDRRGRLTLPIAPPSLHDRSFADLVEEAHRIIRQRSPEWTDLTPSDPGIVLVELFAHLTDVMLYRLNRLPEKAYVEFLRLIGVRLLPPAAAGVTL